MNFENVVLENMPDDSNFDVESVGFIINLSGHYNREQIRILKCLSFIKELEVSRSKLVNPSDFQLGALEAHKTHQIEEMLSSYNQLLAMEFINEKFNGILLSNFGF